MHFDILSRSLNVFEPHFLEASAGTGKTFAIQHLVTRLLIEGSAPLLQLEQILLVTFTKAAARELKLRVRSTLEKTRQELASNTPSADYLQALCEQGAEAVKGALERIDAALLCFDGAQIFTLHSFCYRVLREFAFESDTCMQVSDPDAEEHLALLQQMVQDHLKEEVASPDYSPLQIKSLLSRYRNAPRKMISGLLNLICSGVEIAPSARTHMQACEHLLHAVRSLPSLEAHKVQTDLARLTPLYKEMTGDKVVREIELLSTILATQSCSPQQFDQLLCKDFFLERMSEENLKKRIKMVDPALLHYPDLLHALRHKLLPPIQEASDPTQTLLRLSRELQHKSSALLEQKEVLSPDALLLKVQQALLKSPQFAESVRHKYRAAIIDEFQDTDPVQWDIFKELFLGHIDTLCLVGDPKQSIYAFRNADVYVYLDAAQAMGEGAKKQLGTNFRSTAPLVAALNLLFLKAEEGWMDLPSRKQKLDVIAVKAGAAIEAATGTESPIQFFVASSQKGRSKKFPTTQMLETKVFPYIASEIHLLHTQGQVAYHDIAVLVKDRYQGRSLIDFLKAQGIPASSKRGACITESTAYFALKEMVDAALHSSDIGKVRTALGGPLIGWDVQQILSLSFQAKSQMHALGDTLCTLGFGPFFQQMLQSKWGTLSLEQEILQRGDLTLYLDLRKLLELLLEEEAASGLKAEAFLDYLEEIGFKSQEDDSRLKVAPVEEKGSIQVMTIHMSKGLEFDTVFALGVASRQKPSEQIVVKQEGRSRMIPFDPSDPACQSAILEADAEKLRQFYVALTRAKRRLYVPLMLEEECEEIALGEASAAELFFAKLVSPSTTPQELTLPTAVALLETLSPLISTRVLQEMEGSNVPPPPSSVALQPPLVPSLPKCSERLLSFTALAQKNPTADTVKPLEDAPLSPHTMPLGTQTGQLLHLILEKIFKRGLHHPLNEQALFLLLEEETAFSTLEKWRPVLLPWILSLLRAPVATLPFALCEVPQSQLQTEMEFYYPIAAGAMKGFADLVFVFQGKYYLLDWKSNYLGPSDADYTPENIAEVVRQHQYDLQACIYAEALKRYVKLFDIRPFSECFGGAIYYFVRGSRALHFIPEAYEGV